MDEIEELDKVIIELEKATAFMNSLLKHKPEPVHPWLAETGLRGKVAEMVLRFFHEHHEATDEQIRSDPEMQEHFTELCEWFYRREVNAIRKMLRKRM